MTEISILDAIGEPAMYEMLAEEATELAHAAQKMARILRGEKPTPVTEEGSAGECDRRIHGCDPMRIRTRA